MHDAAKRLQVFLLMHHIQQRGVVFINDDNCFFACLLISSLYDSIQSFVRIVFPFTLTIKFFIGQKL